MSRKDYRVLASALNKASKVARGDEAVGVRLAVMEISKELKADNWRFDESKFIEAINK